MEELKAEFEPKIEKKKQEIAILGEAKRELLEFIDTREQTERDLKEWENLVQIQQDAHKALIEGIEKDRIK